MRILIVCSGNTCRSPMAEVMLREELLRAGVKGVEVASAGLLTTGGEPMSPNSAKVLEANGYDGGEAFRSTSVDRLALDEYDWILCMTRSHHTVLTHRFPEAAQRTRLFAQVEPGLYQDISDPFGGPLERYVHTFEELRSAVAKLVVELKGLSAERRG